MTQDGDWVPQDNEGAKSADDAVNELFAQMTTDEIRALAESEPTTGWPELVRELAIEELERGNRP